MSEAFSPAEVRGEVKSSPSEELRTELSKLYGGYDPYLYPSAALRAFVDRSKTTAERKLQAMMEVSVQLSEAGFTEASVDSIKSILWNELNVLIRMILLTLLEPEDVHLLCSLLRQQDQDREIDYHVCSDGRLSIYRRSTPTEHVV